MQELRPLLEGSSEELLARTEIPPYTREDFLADMRRVTQGRCDEELTDILVADAAEAVRWLGEKGIRWRLMYDRQSFEVDGKRTEGVDPPKSNWAQPLDSPPFYGFAVTCGITFGGVRIDESARVLDRAGQPIKGLHAAGELVGGLFYHNYPGGSGLTSGAAAATHAGARTPGFRNVAEEDSR